MYFCFVLWGGPDASRQNIQELFSYHEQELLSGDETGKWEKIPRRNYFFIAHPVSYFNVIPSLKSLKQQRSVMTQFVLC